MNTQQITLYAEQQADLWAMRQPFNSNLTFEQFEASVQQWIGNKEVAGGPPDMKDLWFFYQTSIRYIREGLLMAAKAQFAESDC
jgi:hypothetical protein